MAHVTKAAVSRLPQDLCRLLGEPTSAAPGGSPRAFTWEGMGGDTVVLARSAASWRGVAEQVKAGLDRHTAAAVVAATTSGFQPLSRRNDLMEVLRICGAQEVCRVVVKDADRIARNHDVLIEVMAQLSQLDVCLEVICADGTAPLETCSGVAFP